MLTRHEMCTKWINDDLEMTKENTQKKETFHFPEKKGGKLNMNRNQNNKKKGKEEKELVMHEARCQIHSTAMLTPTIS